MAYMILFIIFLLFSIIILLFPSLIIKLIRTLIDSGLLFIIGIIEIAVGLVTLYFRTGVQEKWLTVILGILFFIDGVSYLAAPRTIERHLHQFIEEEPWGLHLYAFLQSFLAVCYLVLWL